MDIMKTAQLVQIVETVKAVPSFARKLFFGKIVTRR